MSDLSIPHTFSREPIPSGVLSPGFNTNNQAVVDYINARNSGSATWDALSVSTASGVPVTVNQTGTGNIAEFLDNGDPVATVYDGGIFDKTYMTWAKYGNYGDQTDTVPFTVSWDSVSYTTGQPQSVLTRFTAPKAGVYWIEVRLYSQNGSSYWWAALKKNGTTIISRAAVRSSSSYLSGLVGDIVQLAQGDYIEIIADASVVPVLTIHDDLSGNSYYNKMTVIKIA